MKYKYMQEAMKVTGIRLKELRETTGLTPTTLGKKCGKHHNVILSIENGTTDPSIMLLSELLIVMGLELQDFFNDRYDALFEKSSSEKNESVKV